MKITAYNPQKGRLETIEVEFTNGNTTWFGNCRNAHDIYMITDYDGGLLIGEFNKTYPFWIYDIQGQISAMTRKRLNSSGRCTNRTGAAS